MDISKLRVAIITGASRGIGRTIAERLAAEKFTVIVNFNKGKNAADLVIDEITRAGGSATAIGADVADESAVAAMFNEVVSRFGGIDVVVHAAGILPVKPLTEFAMKEIDEVLTTNLRGTFVVNQQAAKLLRTGGAVINISSAITNNLAPGYSAYAASKAGLEALTKVLARELGPKDITVNAVAPGPTDTEMLQADLINSGNAEQTRQAIIGMTPLGRIGKTGDIAEVVCALAGPFRWVTGQVIHVSGGIAI